MAQTNNRYFKQGDIVLNGEHSVWGSRRFTIERFFGVVNNPMCLAYFTGREKCWKTHSNLCVNDLILVGAASRPMARVNQSILLKLIKAGNIEARREFIMRSNCKKYKLKLN